MKAVEAEILNYIAGEIAIGIKKDDIVGSRDLIGDRILDSIGLQSLIIFLERELKIIIHEIDLMPENFASISAIAHLASKSNKVD